MKSREKALKYGKLMKAFGNGVGLHSMIIYFEHFIWEMRLQYNVRLIHIEKTGKCTMI